MSEVSDRLPRRPARAARQGVAAAGMAAALTLGAPGPAGAVDALAWRADEPRAFGWRVGDVITRRVHLDVPEGWVLDEHSLPPRSRGGALELRQVRLTPAPQGLVMELDYQVFLAPTEPRRVALPTVALRFDARGSGPTPVTPVAPRELRVQPWPVMVGPLVGEATPSGRGFGEWRPDTPAPALDTAGPRRALVITLALALAALAVLLLRPAVEAWWWRRHRPFATAWRAVEAALARGPGEGLDAAYRALHGAFDAHAGRVVWRDEARRLAAAEPAWQGEAAAIDAFYAASRQRFFGAAGVADEVASPAFDADDLRRLARALRDAERLQGAPAGVPAA